MYSCMRFSSLRSSTEESVESNRIDFPKQIRIKRKYLTSQDEVPILCWIGAEDSAGCEEDEVSVVSYADESDEAGGRIYGVPNIEGEP